LTPTPTRIKICKEKLEIMVSTKTCSKCKVVKQYGEFHKHKSSKDGLKSACKACRKITHKKWYVSKYGVFKRKKNIYEDGKMILISPKYGRFEVLVDEEDHERLKEHYWVIKVNASGGHAHKPYVRASTQILHPDGGRDKYGRLRKNELIMSRFIMNAPEGMVVDHINGITTDNRKSNLRICTNAQNMRNHAAQRNNKCGYKGVSYEKPRPDMKGEHARPWAPRIKHGNRFLRLGGFKRIEDAAEAYDRKACEIWDIVSPERMLNFPERFDEYKTTAKEWEEKLKNLELEILREHIEKYGYKGVQYRNSTGKLRKVDRPWYARISINNKSTQIGRYATAEEAAEARDRKACEIRDTINPLRDLNFPERYEEYMAELKSANNDELVKLPNEKNMPK
jgi:hypothetical protein